MEAGVPKPSQIDVELSKKESFSALSMSMPFSENGPNKNSKSCPIFAHEGEY